MYVDTHSARVGWQVHVYCKPAKKISFESHSIMCQGLLEVLSRCKYTGHHAPFIPRAFITDNNNNNDWRRICLGIDLPWEDYRKGKFAQHSRSSFVVWRKEETGSSWLNTFLSLFRLDPYRLCIPVLFRHIHCVCFNFMRFEEVEMSECTPKWSVICTITKRSYSRAVCWMRIYLCLNLNMWR